MLTLSRSSASRILLIVCTFLDSWLCILVNALLVKWFGGAILCQLFSFQLQSEHKQGKAQVACRSAFSDYLALRAQVVGEFHLCIRVRRFCNSTSSLVASVTCVATGISHRNCSSSVFCRTEGLMLPSSSGQRCWGHLTLMCKRTILAAQHSLDSLSVVLYDSKCNRLGSTIVALRASFAAKICLT